MISDFDRRFNRTHRVISVGVILVFIMVSAMFVAMIFGGVHLVKEIKNHGLKSVIESVWEGPEAK